MPIDSSLSHDAEHITIRDADVDDLAVLSDMGKSTFIQAYADAVPRQELIHYTDKWFSLDRLRLELKDKNICNLMAWSDRVPCGYAKLAPTSPPDQISDPFPIELVRLYVLPEWTGRGVGDRLLRRALQMAEARGYQSCWLRVWINNVKAITFYQKRHFQETGREPYVVGNASETVLLMMRSLRLQTG